MQRKEESAAHWDEFRGKSARRHWKSIAGRDQGGKTHRYRVVQSVKSSHKGGKKNENPSGMRRMDVIKMRANAKGKTGMQRMGGGRI